MNRLSQLGECPFSCVRRHTSFADVVNITTCHRELLMNLRDRYPDFHAVLNELRKRPSMFFGDKSAFGLHMWLAGIEFAELFHGVEKDSIFDGFDFAKFEQWVKETFNPLGVPLTSVPFAEHLTKSDAEAFDLWFRWYDEFMAGQIAT